MVVFCRRHRLWAMLAFAAGVVLLAAAGLYAWLLADLPSLEDPGSLYTYAAAPSSKMYDRYGRLLFEMPPPHTGSHSPVPLAEIPQALRDATVATEDASFYDNPGVDAGAILRAVWINLRGGEVLSGGSTITQQLARTLLLSPEERYERSLARKVREAVLAWRLARNYSKDEILALYLNEIYFGNMAYGVEAAAQAILGKPVRDLDLAECAMLAGLPQAPAYYNPLENLPEARKRQAVVLDLMVKHGYLTEEQARLAREEPLHFAASPFPIRAPHCVMSVRGLLEKELGLERLELGGLHIYTTLDVDLNDTARDLARYRLARLAECNGESTDCPPGGHNVRNLALVALDPQTGEILAMLGSPDYFSARIDGAVNGTTALRQPGSAIKPITYAAAFQSGKLTAATMMLDVRTSFVTREGESYVPLNYDLRFRGPVRLREALASSYNLIAVQVLDAVGVEAMTGLARRLGIRTFDDPDRLGLSVTLGGGEVRLLELTAAYAAFANGGHTVHPVAVRRVEDERGQLLWAPDPGLGTRVVDERVAYLVTDILSDDVARIPSFGEGSVLALSRPAAVKTGTTTDFLDNWTVGYTPELAVGVWAGNADNEPMRDISGVSGAAPTWHDLTELALKGRLATAFPRPDGMVEVEVCALSGHLPGLDCPHRVRELFLEGTEPAETCTMHRRVAIDRATGLPAAAGLPPQQVAYRVVTVWPPEAEQWARENGVWEPAALAAAPLVTQTLALAAQPEAADGRLVMTAPDEGAVYRLDPALPRDAQRISVSASSGMALRRLTLLVDGQAVARFETPPYRVLWRLEPGAHTFRAEGLRQNGVLVTSGAVRVEVREP